MGLLSFLGVKSDLPDIQAQLAPAIMSTGANAFWGNSFGGYGSNTNVSTVIDINEALSVPAVARCNNLIKGTIAPIPLKLIKKSTGEQLSNPVWLDQPDVRQPRYTTMSFTVQSLLMYGVAYWKVEELYADDNRPSRFSWVSNNRISIKTNQLNTEIEYYILDGHQIPMSGIGSLITFQFGDTGILFRGGRTIQSALDVERAVQISANTPMPTGIIKNNGSDLPETQVQGLLAAFKSARQNRSIAYLTSTLEFQPVAFAPKDMMYNDAAQYLALQIARMCNVPATYLSAEIIRTMTYSNVLDERRQFTDLTLMPFFECVASRLSMDDITGRGLCVEFDIEQTFLKTDALTRLAVIEKMLQLNLIDINTAREMENLSPEGSDDETNTMTTLNPMLPTQVPVQPGATDLGVNDDPNL